MGGGALEGLFVAYVGGIRSGKSALAHRRFAEELPKRGLRSPVYLGTLLEDATAQDVQLTQRVQSHRAARPEAWATLAVAQDLPGTAQRCLLAGHDAWLLDGLGAWGALNLDQAGDAMIALEAFLTLARSVPLVVVVLDEVGQGGIAGHAAARAFADLNGLFNQTVCGEADEAWSVQAGLALRLK